MAKKHIDNGKALCLVLVSAIPGTATPCAIPLTTTAIVLLISQAVITIILAISEALYTFLVDNQNLKFEREQHQVTFENIGILHANMISNFKLGTQIKLLLGGVLDAMPTNDGEGDETRRRLTDHCEDAINGICNNDTTVSCEDPQYLCNGFSTNWNYVAFLKFGEKSIVSPIRFSNCPSLLLLTHHEFSFVLAGCDSKDSDGTDGQKPDICEDRYPPSLLIRDPVYFRGDDNDTTRLVYREKVFKSEQSVKNFLGYQFSVDDNCQPSENLELIINRTGGSCRETQYTVTPVQNIPACNDRNSSGPPFNIPFVNPLTGASKFVTVQLDEEPPVIQCGFRRGCTPGVNFVSDDGRTLYHYRSTLTDISDYELNEAKFFYDVVVSIVC